MPKAKKESHHNSHCWGRCVRCLKNGLACNGGMALRWTACFGCGQAGVGCEKAAKSREEALVKSRRIRGRVDSVTT
jgi:hypothetical protein